MDADKHEAPTVQQEPSQREMREAVEMMYASMREQNEKIQVLQNQLAKATKGQQERKNVQPSSEGERLAQAIHMALQGSQQEPGRRPKAVAENPAAFDGKDRSQYAAFRHKLVAKMEIDNAFWRNNYERVNHMFGCLSGAAEAAMRPWVEAHAESVSQTAEDAPKKFLERLDSIFHDRELQDRAYVKMTTLRQRNTPFEDHLALFQQYLMESGETGMTDRGKKVHLRNGLNDELRQVLVGVEEKEDFEGFCRQLQGIADRMREEQGRRRNTRNSYNRSRNDGARHEVQGTRYVHTPAVPSPAPAASDTMDWEPTAARGQSTPARRAKWVSQEEVQRRRESGVCLRCGGSNHRIVVCPFAPARRPQNYAAPVAVHDALLEDDEGDDLGSVQGKE